MTTPKVKGYIFQTYIGAYYSAFGAGCVGIRELAHVYTKEGLIDALKKAHHFVVHDWGSKNAGKWIIVYED